MHQKETELPDDGQSPAAAATDSAARQAAGPTPPAQDAAPAEEAARPQQAQAGEPPQNEDEAAASAKDDEIATLREALQQAQQEAEANRDQALRAAAEADNIRKRAQRETEAARKFALEKFATELLAVRDSLEMGLAASEQEQADPAKLAEGMELTNRMLATAMEKFGIEVVDPQGEVFNPELHEAVSTHETEAQAANTVVSVMQKGYTLNGRVLRAAMVVVAKAPA
ncbi:MAG TPA: nucleotide exchange factor GrpE [Salinisphaeraceae bacterium]|nr:nucleotide exchange factor GrpE [Salinisphaeraceae bacterium]